MTAEPENPRPRVLIADDNEMFRDAVSMVLMMKGYDPIEAEDGAQTISILSAEPVDFLLLDLQMPVMTGYEVLEWMKRHSVDCGLAIATGGLVDLNRLGSDVTLFHKPFRMADLIETIEASLEAQGQPCASA